MNVARDSSNYSVVSSPICMRTHSFRKLDSPSRCLIDEYWCVRRILCPDGSAKGSAFVARPPILVGRAKGCDLVINTMLLLY